MYLYTKCANTYLVFKKNMCRHISSHVSNVTWNRRNIQTVFHSNARSDGHLLSWEQQINYTSHNCLIIPTADVAHDFLHASPIHRPTVWIMWCCAFCAKIHFLPVLLSGFRCCYAITTVKEVMLIMKVSFAALIYENVVYAITPSPRTRGMFLLNRHVGMDCYYSQLHW